MMESQNAPPVVSRRSRGAQKEDDGKRVPRLPVGDQWRAGRTQRASEIIDDWAASIYLEARRVQRMIELDGRPLSPEARAVLDFLIFNFADDFEAQLLLFVAWRQEGAVELSPEPAPG